MNLQIHGLYQTPFIVSYYFLRYLCVWFTIDRSQAGARAETGRNMGNTRRVAGPGHDQPQGIAGHSHRQVDAFGVSDGGSDGLSDPLAVLTKLQLKGLNMEGVLLREVVS